MAADKEAESAMNWDLDLEDEEAALDGMVDVFAAPAKEEGDVGEKEQATGKAKTREEAQLGEEAKSDAEAQDEQTNAAQAPADRSGDSGEADEAEGPDKDAEVSSEKDSSSTQVGAQDKGGLSEAEIDELLVMGGAKDNDKDSEGESKETPPTDDVVYRPSWLQRIKSSSSAQFQLGSAAVVLLCLAYMLASGDAPKPKGHQKSADVDRGLSDIDFGKKELSLEELDRIVSHPRYDTARSKVQTPKTAAVKVQPGQVGRPKAMHRVQPGQLIDPSQSPRTPSTGVVVGGVPERPVRSSRVRRTPQGPSLASLYRPGGSISVVKKKKTAKRKKSAVPLGLEPGDLVEVLLVDGLVGQVGSDVLVQVRTTFKKRGKIILKAGTIIKGRGQGGTKTRFSMNFEAAYLKKTGAWHTLFGYALQGRDRGVIAKQLKMTLENRSQSGVARGLLKTGAGIAGGLGGPAGRVASNVVQEVVPEVEQEVSPQEVVRWKVPAKTRFFIRITDKESAR